MFFNDFKGSFEGKSKWTLKFTWLPKRCDLTGQRIWLTRGYYGIAMWTGPDDPAYETRWHRQTEHLIWEMKGRNEKHSKQTF